MTLGIHQRVSQRQVAALGQALRAFSTELPDCARRLLGSMLERRILNRWLHKFQPIFALLTPRQTNLRSRWTDSSRVRRPAFTTNRDQRKTESVSSMILLQPA
jgi:hypothetical protein